MFMWLWGFFVIQNTGWLRMRQLVVAKWRWADRMTQVLYSVHVPRGFVRPLSKLSHIMFFSDYRFFLLSIEKLIQRLFSCGACCLQFQKKGKKRNEGENLQCWKVWLFLWFRSFKSRWSRLPPLGMPSTSSLSTSAKHLPLSLWSESLCCRGALHASESQMYLTSAVLFLPIYFQTSIVLSDISIWMSRDSWNRKDLFSQTANIFGPLFFFTLSDPFPHVLLG